ncbi:hypothetical protein [Rufibacter soli]
MRLFQQSQLQVQELRVEATGTLFSSKLAPPNKDNAQIPETKESGSLFINQSID